MSVDSELAITKETGMVCFKVSVIDDGVIMKSVLSYKITFSLRWTNDDFAQESTTTIYGTHLTWICIEQITFSEKDDFDVVAVYIA